MISKRQILLTSLSFLALVTSATTPKFLEREVTPDVTNVGDYIKIENPKTGLYNIVPADVPVYFNNYLVSKPRLNQINVANQQTSTVLVNMMCNFDTFWPDPYFLHLKCCAEDGYVHTAYFDGEMEYEEEGNHDYILSAYVEVPLTGGYIIVNAPSAFWDKPGILWLVEYISDPTIQTEITLNPEMGTRHFSWQMLDTDGKPLNLQKGHFDEALEEWVYSSKGNATIANFSIDVLFEDIYLGSAVLLSDYTPDNTPEESEFYSLWTNYCGEKVWINYSILMETESISYWAYGNAPMGNTTSFTNNPSTYKVYNFEIKPQPNSIETIDPAYLGLYTIGLNNLMGFDLTSDNSLKETPIGEFSLLHQSDMSTYIKTGTGQYEYTNRFGWVNPIYTITPYYEISSESFTQIPIFTTYREKFQNFLPSSKKLLYRRNEMTASFGEGPSIITNDLTFSPDWEDHELMRGSATYNSMGVMGEVRDADKYLMQYSASFEGQEIFSDIDFNALSSEFESWCSTKPGNGLLSLKAVNTNQTLDEIPVTTTAESFINYGNKEVWSPTMLLMNLRDNSDRIGFNLSSSTGAKAVIGAIASQLNLDTYQHNFSQVDVEVEYTQHGNEDWTVLPTETSEEPGVGTLAVTSLSEIGEDAKGLYDLRITVTAEDGNKFIETVSPAFRIIGESSIESVTDSAHGTPTIYNLQGVRVSTPTPGLNILVYPDGTVRKQIIR